MKKRNAWLLLCFTAVLLVNCSKKDTVQPTPPPTEISYKDKIILNDLDVTSEGVKLSWTKLDTSNFVYYQVTRSCGADSLNFFEQTALTQIRDQNILSFTDTDVPYAPYVIYLIEAYVESPYGLRIVSNSKIVKRSEIKFLSINVSSEIHFDKDHNKLVSIDKDNGQLTLINPEDGSIIKSITTSAKFGYTCMGRYNNRTEIYVPRNDGWIYIYDAETLDKIDQINTNVNNIPCLQFSNNKIYFSLQNDYYGYNNAAISYADRVTKEVYVRSSYYSSNSTRFFIVPNTNATVLDVQPYYYYNPLTLYTCNTQTMELTKTAVWSNTSAPLDANIFKFYPGGKYFVTSSSGAVYNINLETEQNLPHGNHNFSDFAIDDAETTIYAACNNEKLIISYSASKYEEIKQYKTKGFPCKIFKSGGQLYSLSMSNTYYGYPNKYFLEKISL